MTLDVLQFIDGKGGNSEEIRESQRKRGLSVELVDEVIQMYNDWVRKDYEVNQTNKDINAIQKEIGAKKKAKENADELVAKKKSLDGVKENLVKESKELEIAMRSKASTVGNIIGPNVPISMTEDDNQVLRTWKPEAVEESPAGGAGATPATSGESEGIEKLQTMSLAAEDSTKSSTNIMPHHEVLLRLDAMDLDRGAKIAGHRGFFLTGDGVDLNQALISYGLDFLRNAGYKKVQPPFFMNKDQMAKTAQLDQFDEELYRLNAGSSHSGAEGASGGGDENDKYLIATSEQPISAFHSEEWFEDPKTQLPIKYAGYSTCFRKEAGSAGRDMWGIFRVHQFEKVEQFCITEPTDGKSWAMLDEMLLNSEKFYQSLKIPYRVVAIVSGALNLAAAQKYDLEAWFPFQKEYKELVSCSNCTDYQSRRLEVRCGLKAKDQTRKVYVHMLNGTLCATERALCCIVENYQTPDGLRIPDVLQPYMQGRTFLPWVKELPKNLQRKKA